MAPVTPSANREPPAVSDQRPLAWLSGESAMPSWVEYSSTRLRTRRANRSLSSWVWPQHSTWFEGCKVPRRHPHRAYFAFGRTWRARNQQTVQFAATNLLEVLHDIKMVRGRLLSRRAGKFSN